MKLTEHLEHELRFQKENCWQIYCLLYFYFSTAWWCFHIIALLSDLL